MDHGEQWVVLYMKISFQRIKMLSHSNLIILKTLLIKSNVDQLNQSIKSINQIKLFFDGQKLN